MKSILKSPSMRRIRRSANGPCKGTNTCCANLCKEISPMNTALKIPFGTCHD